MGNIDSMAYLPIVSYVQTIGRKPLTVLAAFVPIDS